MMIEKLSLLKEILGEYHKEGLEQHLFQCPERDCHHYKRKLSINIDKNLCKCWICDKSSSITALIKRHGSKEQFKRWTSLTGEIDLSRKIDFLKKKEEKEEILSLPEEFKTLATEKGSITAIKPLNYLKSRNIDDKDILKWKIGYVSSGSYAERVIIPSFNDDGKINYFVARSYNDNYIKYLNPKIDHDFVFNSLFINWEDDIVIVEGVFDAIVAGNAIPLLTSTLREKSNLFKSLVEKGKRIFLALDPDAKAKEIKIIKSFLKYDKEVYKIEVEPYEDVAQMTKTEFLQRKREATPINGRNFLMLKIRNGV